MEQWGHRLKRAPPLLQAEGPNREVSRGRRRAPSDSGINLLKVSLKDTFRKTSLGRSKSSAGNFKRPASKSVGGLVGDNANIAHQDMPPPPTSSADDNPRIVVDGDHPTDLRIPLLLQRGTPLVKISSKKQKTVQFHLDADAGIIRWESKKGGKSRSIYRKLSIHES